jgi:hypothetical protein
LSRAPGGDNPRWLERLLSWAVYPLRSEANAFRMLVAVGAVVAAVVIVVVVVRAIAS